MPGRFGDSSTPAPRVAVVDKSDPMPRYLQVRRILEEGIRSGRYRPGKRLPGERDLAKMLDVSQMTVNKAVLALVQDGWLYRENGSGTYVCSDFRPPVPALLRIGLVSTIGCEHIQNDYYLGSVFRGIQQAMANEPVHLSLREAPEEALFERLRDLDLDGLLLVYISEQSLPAVRRLCEEGKRVVMIGAGREAPDIPSVDGDNVEGTRAAVRHLLEQGHRRIAGVFAYMEASNTRDRRDAFVNTLRESGIAAPPLLEMADESAERHRLAPAVQRFLQETPRPTAFFCGGHQLALVVMREIQKAGLRIPDDVSLVGFDDPSFAAHLLPPLTTVRQPLNDIGRRATLRLLRWLKTGEEPGGREVLPTEFMLRSSTAPPPAG